jgi:rare lipoprotein A
MHPAPAEILIASWYSRASLVKEKTWKDGKEKRMANGEKFDDNKFTAACNLYSLDTWLLVTDIASNKKVFVKVTDRIAKRFDKTRIDLSKAAMLFLGGQRALEQGLLQVKVEELK